MRSTIIAVLVTTLVCFGLTPPVRAQTDQPTGDDMAAPTSTPAAGRNRLGDETSPYLLQHQHNPVHWWPWGEEAFTAARAADKPIFLSIGYSTCYWCHVMERECFENADVAAVMNELFVCIKVDREERPDVDDIYMSATQIYNQGRGGWPMSVFLEPESLQPFFAGTYFPAEQFTELLRSIGTFWRDQRETVITGSNELADRVRQMHEMRPAPRAISRSTILQAIALVLQAYDVEHGGFGAGRNKFPTPVYLELLMNAGWDDPEVRAAVTHTLDRMATGGMYDQIGGGFHRYSTDREWLVPHFEKMLYDNGQLASAYARAYELTNDPFYAEIVRETLDYVLREMLSADGAFWSAQDAEVNHLEGGNYLWLAEEVREVLTAADQANDVDFALSVYGFDRGTNFQDPHHPEAGRKNVVFLTDTPATLAKQLDMDPGEFDARLRRVNATLLAARDLRDQPSTDDKVLAGWNGLMIAGFADGGRILKSPAYVDAARAAARFVIERMRTPDGGLLRTARADQVKIDAFLEDYAFMIRGLLALARATDETVWIDAAVELEAAARGRFWDDEHGAWFDAPDGQTDLFVRIKSTYDGATPAGNSAMLNALADLYEATGDAAYLERARAAMSALSSDLADRPTASTLGMLAVARIGTLDPTVLAEDVPSQAGAVQVRVSPETVALAAGAEARVELTLRIGEGFHINAHEPGMDDLIPLGIRLIGGDGVRVEPAYPAGEVFDGPLGSMKVHGGEVTIPVVVTRTGAVTGQERIMLVYQACTDTVCLQPVSAVLPLTIAAAEDPTP